MLGIIIGIAAIIAIVSTITGTNEKIKSQLVGSGKNTVDVQLYEAAKMDGANRFQRVLHVTLPAMKSIIIIQLILRMGNFLNTGFEQILLALNSSNRAVAEVFDTYVYETALQSGRISYGTAIGMFKSVVSLVLVITVNHIAKRAGEEGVY